MIINCSFEYIIYSSTKWDLSYTCQIQIVSVPFPGVQTVAAQVRLQSLHCLSKEKYPFHLPRLTGRDLVEIDSNKKHKDVVYLIQTLYFISKFISESLIFTWWEELNISLIAKLICLTLLLESKVYSHSTDFL